MTILAVARRLSRYPFLSVVTPDAAKRRSGAGAPLRVQDTRTIPAEPRVLRSRLALRLTGMTVEKTGICRNGPQKKVRY